MLLKIYKLIVCKAFFPSEYNVDNYNGGRIESVQNIDKDCQKRKISLAHSSASVEETTSEDSDSDSSTSSISDHDITADTETANLLFPNSEGVIDIKQSNMLCQIRKGNDLSRF